MHEGSSFRCQVDGLANSASLAKLQTSNSLRFAVVSKTLVFSTEKRFIEDGEV